MKYSIKLKNLLNFLVTKGTNLRQIIGTTCYDGGSAYFNIPLLFGVTCIVTKWVGELLPAAGHYWVNNFSLNELFTVSPSC